MDSQLALNCTFGNSTCTLGIQLEPLKIYVATSIESSIEGMALLLYYCTSGNSTCTLGIQLEPLKIYVATSIESSIAFIWLYIWQLHLCTWHAKGIRGNFNWIIFWGVGLLLYMMYIGSRRFQQLIANMTQVSFFCTYQKIVVL